MSVLDLFSVPIGTIVGLIGIWLFGFDATVRNLFGTTTWRVSRATASRRMR